MTNPLTQRTMAPESQTQATNKLNDLLSQKKKDLDEDMMFSRNFELVISTVLKYDDIFSDEEREGLQKWIEMSIPCKTLYSRMFFRRRYWYTIRQLKNYSEHSGNIEDTLKRLNEQGFLKNDQDAINEFDYERLQELLEAMVSVQIKQVELDLKKIIRGYVPENLDKCINQME